MPKNAERWRQHTVGFLKEKKCDSTTESQSNFKLSTNIFCLTHYSMYDKQGPSMCRVSGMVSRGRKHRERDSLFNVYHFLFKTDSGLVHGNGILC